jgi:hypothetical protein
MTIKWRCPNCGADADKHGKGGTTTCRSQGGTSDGCAGLLCECDSDVFPDSEKKNHGTDLANPCTNAYCYHCHWGGTLPVKPKGLQPWEKKALEAGWTPPVKRAKELKL